MRFDCVVTLVALAMCAGAAFSGAVPAAVGPADGATVTVHTAKQSAYLSKSMAEREAVGKDRAQHSALTKADDPRWSGVDHAGTFPQPVTLSWTGEGPFTVEVRRASDSKVFFAATGIAANSVDVFNFEIGCTYRWTVGNASGISPASTFTTDSVFPRLLWDRDGEGKIYGVRDLGGCFVSNGAYRVRQGLVFRSSKLNDNATGTTPGASFVSDANRSTWLDDFGVRYELDLRGGSGEAGNLTASPLGGTVTYKHISGVDYGIADSVANKTAIKNELVYALDPAHYPLVFHCSIGHDRTGTLALLMHGLLGVSEDDILRNYEASWFWYCKGTDSGVAGHYSGINRIRTALAAYSGATMADRVVAYCKSIGITDAEIAAFRAAMLEPVGGTPAIVAPEIGATVEVQTDLQKGFLTLDAATRKSDAWFGSEEKRSELMGARPLNTHPRKVTLAWSGDGAPWTVTLRKDGSDDAPVAVWSNVADDHVTVDNLEVGCGYRWTVSGSAGSATGTFATEDVTPRFLRAGSRTAAEGGPDVSNVRDMGGYVGLDGRRVRQGRLFRTGQLDRDGVSILSDETRAFFCDFLKVKTEIDLRGTLSASPLGAGVALVDAEVLSYAHYSNAEGAKSTTVTGFKALFAALSKEASYPAFFHCAAGQDRTGCIAYILGALLGVDESELVKDWEASVFHNAKGGFGFALSADYQAGDYYDLDVFVRGLRTFGKATMRENAEAWAKHCGCTDADIAAFRSLMLEPSGFGDADTAAVTYTWSATGEGPWMRPANWTPSVTPCYGVPDAPKATVTFPATVAEGTVVCPEGVTGELSVVDKSLCVVLTAEGAPEEPIVDYYETTPFAREKTIVCYGDSLTHGYGGNEIVIPATPNYFDGRDGRAAQPVRVLVLLRPSGRRQGESEGRPDDRLCDPAHGARRGGLLAGDRLHGRGARLLDEERRLERGRAGVAGRRTELAGGVRRAGGQERVRRGRRQLRLVGASLGA